MVSGSKAYQSATTAWVARHAIGFTKAMAIVAV
jgi:hypothetical protein